MKEKTRTKRIRRRTRTRRRRRRRMENIIHVLIYPETRRLPPSLRVD